MLALRAAASSPSRVDSRMFSRTVSAIAAKNANSGRPGPLGAYIPGSGPASISRTGPWAVRWSASAVALAPAS
ncbi:hypothetical protein [Streptomyces sp. ISL-11]|uniref:hypothetical protein n=1 Tax=Streptomyces sp. ISL-11 TaxID=2819174 RepID=UPI001BEA5218